jgi:predicted small lipoprotein YifL
MSRARVSLGLAAALTAFALLEGCGQRGPLTLPESERPIQRLDKSAAPAPTPGSAPATGAPAPGTAPPAATPEDDERAKK